MLSFIVGMSLSIMLAEHGIKSIACERYGSTATHPRALFLIRTIENFLALGMIKTILQESEKHRCIQCVLTLDTTTHTLVLSASNLSSKRELRHISKTPSLNYYFEVPNHPQ